MKYYHIKLFPLVFLLLVVMSVHGAGWQKAVACADKKAQQKYYVIAAEKYEHLLSGKCIPADSAYAVKIKLANCYLKMGNTTKAETNYADAVKSGKTDAATTFNYARSLEANSKYAEAKEWFDKIAADKTIKDKNVKGFSDKCDRATKATPDNKYHITKEHFNTNASEYAPAYYKEGLAYTSNSAERFITARRILWNKDRYTDIYTVQIENKMGLRMVNKMSAPINSKLNDGACVFNAAFDEVFFTRNNKHCKKHDQLQILTSKFNGSDWSKPTVLGFETSAASYAHPSLSADGNTLYFASDMAGGQGGMDIYMVNRNGNVWGVPVNLGPLVNSSGNETFPFIAADSSLYFTSDGHPGYGGMDLFHSKYKEGKFAKPDNMGVDFNSPKDDLSMIVDVKNRTGYFASNRDGDDDIFSFKLPVKKLDEKEKQAQDTMRTTGRVADKVKSTPISGARVEISKLSNPVSGVYYYTNDSGLFSPTKKIEADDQIRVFKDKYKPATVNGGAIADTKAFVIPMDSEVVLSNTRLDFTTIYYDVNKSNLTSATMELLRPVIDRMRGSVNEIVYVSGYADEQGGDTYNYGLSLRRVKDVVDYLTSQGVDAQRVHSAFYGAVKLSDKCRSSPKCATDTDRENRRVEIFISNP